MSPRTTNAARLRLAAGAPRRGGFTILETMMALVIIGIGVLAFVDAHSAFMQSNNWSSTAGTGMLLANEIREMTRRLPRHDPVTSIFLDGSGGGSPVLRGWGRETGEVTSKDIDDIDDLDGVTFGLGGTLGGPIDAFGEVIPAVDNDGNIVMSGGAQVSLEGWTQRVLVQKVDPYNFNLVRAQSYAQAATGELPAIAVDQFPLKVTVIVEHQSVNDVTPQEVTRVWWIVPTK